MTELASVRAAVYGEQVFGPNESAIKAAAARASIVRGIEGEIALLRPPSVAVRLREVALFSAFWVAGGALVMRGLGTTGSAHWLLRIAGTLLIALALHVFALLMHDGVHHSLLRNRTANRWMSVALGACLLISSSAYQAMHERHHVFLGDTRDPDHYQNYAGRRVVWLLHFVRLFLGTFLYLVLIPVMIARKASRSEQRRVLVEYAILAAVYALLWRLAPHRVLLHAWLIPIIPAGIMFNIRSLAAHSLTDPSDPLLASRSIEAHPVVAFFFRNENYHLDHHLFPEIPSYNLARVHSLIRPRMPRATIGHSYMGFLRQFVKQSLRFDDTPIGVVHYDR